MSKSRKLIFAAWALSAAVLVAAFIAWGQGQRWDFSRLGSYDLFPLFGLVAFSLMWAHYIMGVIRHRLNVDKVVLVRYFEITSFIVLLSILLHPGLLIWQLWRDGFGLPPQSYLENYVAPGLRGAVFLGSVSLFIILAYELRRIFHKRKWWKFVVYAGDAAMIAIFYHGLQLGGELQSGWYRAIWFFYGSTLILALAYTYISGMRKQT